MIDRWNRWRRSRRSRLAPIPTFVPGTVIVSHGLRRVRYGAGAVVFVERTRGLF